MNNLSTTFLSICLLASTGLTSTAYARDSGVNHYAITITNLTRGQIFAPPAVVAHNSEYHMFTLGSAPSYELSQLAEAGNGQLVLDAATTMNSVYKTALGTGGILPGTSQTIEIDTTNEFPEISIGAMLATTNDGFMAISGIQAPRHGSITVVAEGYDAGSEANSESCAFIPGPPCGDKNHNPATAEGYVRVHEGMHGISAGAYNPAQLDWRNPVAQIEIKHMR